MPTFSTDIQWGYSWTSHDPKFKLYWFPSSGLSFSSQKSTKWVYSKLIGINSVWLIHCLSFHSIVFNNLSFIPFMMSLTNKDLEHTLSCLCVFFQDVSCDHISLQELTSSSFHTSSGHNIRVSPSVCWHSPWVCIPERACYCIREYMRYRSYLATMQCLHSSI